MFLHQQLDYVRVWEEVVHWQTPARLLEHDHFIVYISLKPRRGRLPLPLLVRRKPRRSFGFGKILVPFGNGLAPGIEDSEIGT